jgi:hypothetical protein
VKARWGDGRCLTPVALTLKRPPDHGDDKMAELLRNAADQAGCVAIEIAAIGLIVECEPAAVDLPETARRRPAVPATCRLIGW